jgi:hypothetical protein
LCEKTPENIFRINAIRSIFPNARFVWLVRAPFAVASSIQRLATTSTTGPGWYGWRDAKWRSFRRVAERNGLSAMFDSAGTDPFARALLEWRLSVRAGLSAISEAPNHASDILPILYEDLVSHPRVALLRVFRHARWEVQHTDITNSASRISSWDRNIAHNRNAEMHAEPLQRAFEEYRQICQQYGVSAQL